MKNNESGRIPATLENKNDTTDPAVKSNGFKGNARKASVGALLFALFIVVCAPGWTFGPSNREAAQLGESIEGVQTGEEDGSWPVLAANEGKSTGDVGTILANAENAPRLDSLNFYGFYTGMSFADAKTLRDHYGLTEKHLRFLFNKQNGEVVRMSFDPKAITTVMKAPNNFPTIELRLREYLGIVAWNSGTANAPRVYQTADGVIAKLYTKGWDSNDYWVFEITDASRKIKADSFNPRFDSNNAMRKRYAELKSAGRKPRMLKFPTGYEWVMRDFGKGMWVGDAPVSMGQLALFVDGKADKELHWRDICEREGRDGYGGDDSSNSENIFAGNLNAIPSERFERDIVRFREPFPDEMEAIGHEGLTFVGGKEKDDIPTAIIIAEDGSSAQLNRRAMFVSRRARGDIMLRAWYDYNNKALRARNAGASEADLARMGLTMNYDQWARAFCKDNKGFKEFCKTNGGLFDDKTAMMFFPAVKMGCREAAWRERKEAEQRAKEEAKRREQEEAERRAREHVVKSLIAGMVQIPGRNYMMGKFEVTQAQWEAVMGSNPSQFKGADNPVECVSWNDCQEFLKKINALPDVKKSDLLFRLPTEEEWDHACLAGATGDFCRLADGTEIREDTYGRVAWFQGNADEKTHPVGQREPNAFGLYDMYGNVWEWTATASDTNHVARGSGVNHPSAPYGLAYRLWILPDSRYADLGFRLCASEWTREDRRAAERRARDQAFEKKRKTAISDLINGMTSIPGKGFKMGKCEVTQAQWAAVTGWNPSYFKEPDHPVEWVSWDDCQIFLKTLNELPAVKESKLVFRLPTEEEWDYACRAGAARGSCKLTDGTEITKETFGQIAWFKPNAGGKTHPVGEKKPNAFGLHDMHGNVWEWTATTNGEFRIRCGGSWFCGAEECNEPTQYHPLGRAETIGLRLCAEDERILAERRASNHAIVVKAPKMVKNPWDTIFWFKSAETFKAGDRWEVSMRIKADKKAEGSHAAKTQTHAGLDKHISGTGIGDVPFDTEWSVYERSGTFVNAQEGGNFITFSLNYFPDANVYYFDDISFKINGREMIVNGNCEGSDWSSFWVREGRSHQPGKPISAANIVSVPATGGEREEADRRAREERAAAERRASNHAIVVKSQNKVKNPWDTEFWFTSAATFKAGDKWEVSMKVKAGKGPCSISTQFQKEPGKYITSNAIGNVPFGTEWSVYERSGTFAKDQEGGSSISFHLNHFPEANVYYFDDVSFKINGREMIVNGNCEGSDWSSFWVREGGWNQPIKPISAANVVSVPAAGAK